MIEQNMLNNFSEQAHEVVSKKDHAKYDQLLTFGNDFYFASIKLPLSSILFTFIPLLINSSIDDYQKIINLDRKHISFYHKLRLDDELRVVFSENTKLG